MNFLKMYKWKNNIILTLAHYFEDNSLYGLAYLIATKLQKRSGNIVLKTISIFNSIIWPSLLIVFATVKNVIISKWLVNLAASLA